MQKSVNAGVRGVVHGLLVILILGNSLPVALAGPKSGGDLFEQPYVYLIRGDEKFQGLAVNYFHTVPTPDSMFQVTIHPRSKKLSDTLPDAQQYLNISVEHPMALRMILADSSTTNLIVFEFKKLPIGEYTMGEKDWPKPLGEIFASNRRCNVLFAADLRYQGRFRFEVDSNSKMVRIEQPAIPRKQ